jgi:hypothetical protein
MKRHDQGLVPVPRLTWPDRDRTRASEVGWEASTLERAIRTAYTVAIRNLYSTNAAHIPF